MNYYVNQKVTRSGDGSKERPFKWINEAAKIAKPGDEVIVSPGLYREYVDPVNAGCEDNRIIYRSEVPLGAIITGAEEAKGWEKYEEDTWVLYVDNGVFGAYNPYTTTVSGDWYFSPDVRHTGAVYLNDRMMYETLSLEECLKGEKYIPSWEQEWSIYKWFTVQENGKTVIYANFKGKNPNEENVEINVRRNCFMPSKTGVSYITFSGFNVTKAATTWAPPAAFQDGMIGPHWSKGWIIEDCDISNSKCSGISLGKYYDEENEQYYTRKQVKSATQMERDATCRGQYHGWSKETIGSHIVRRCNIHHCEQTGIVGRMGCVFSLIEDNHIHHINNMQQLGGAEIAGIKFHAAIDVTFRRNHIHHCTMGIWCDWQAQGTRISQNLFHDNHMPEGSTVNVGSMMNQDVFIEVSHGPTIIDNNIMLSKVSINLATEGVAVINNLMLGAFTNVGSGTDFIVDEKNQPRYTPYHIRHQTEVAGFMTILHGDDRIYNNIFIQNYPIVETKAKGNMGFGMLPPNQIVGTSVFDEYPTYDKWIGEFDLDTPANMFTQTALHFRHLPVWVDGNAYFNGAVACKNEEKKFVDENTKIYVNLIEKEGKYTLDTNLYDVLGEFSTKIISTETLGLAFEPEQRFENPDETSIIFNEDYFGDYRGLSAVPGPFVTPQAAKNVLN